MIKTKASCIILTLILSCCIYVFIEMEKPIKEKRLTNTHRLYKNYKNVNGKTFALTWEDPRKLNYFACSQMKKLFIESFVFQYRTNKDLLNFTNKQLEEDLSHYFTKNIIPRFNSYNEQLLLFAKEKEKIVGFIFWEVLNENQAYVAELVIAPDYWRQGLGKEFMESIFDKKPNVKKIVLLTEHKNHGARNFYKALGYKPSLYERKGYDVKDFCAYEMEI